MPTVLEKPAYQAGTLDREEMLAGLPGASAK